MEREERWRDSSKDESFQINLTYRRAFVNFYFTLKLNTQVPYNEPIHVEEEEENNNFIVSLTNEKC